MTDFQQFVLDAEARRADGTTDPKSQYAKWAAANPGELGRWQAFRDLILNGGSPAPPIMLTPHGRELVDGGIMFLKEAKRAGVDVCATTVTPIYVRGH